MKKVCFISMKGGVGKSTLCDFIKLYLLSGGHKAATINTDDQKHVHVDTDPNTLRGADIVLFDTMGALYGETLELLQDIAKDDIIICPVGTGETDQLEYDFLISQFTKYGVLANVVFVFNRVNIRSKSFGECKALLQSKGVKVAKAAISDLETYARKKPNHRTNSEIGKLVHEVIL